MALSRRSHAKSRLGCKTCKSRKVKCDEQRPECRNCVRHNVPCDFLESSAKVSALSPAPSSNGLGGNLNMADLELLHHYSTYTYVTLSEQLVMRDYCRINLVQIGFKCDYIMRTLLAISGMHLAHHRKQSFDYYTSLAAAHHEAATRTAMELMKDLNAENAPMLFLYSSLTMYYALGAPRQKSNFLLVGESGFPDWMFLLRGSRLFHSYLTEDGALKPLLHDARQRWIRMFSARLPDDDPAKRHLDNIGKMIAEETTTAITAAEDKADDSEREATVSRLRHNQNVYLEAISKMEHALAGCRRTASPDDGVRRGSGVYEDGVAARMAFIWLFEVTEGLLPLLQTEPTPQEAAVLLAFFAALLQKSSNHWWTQGWPEHLIARIYALLDQNHRLWIRWPIEEMGWIPPP